jgi:hypothetical protein
MTGDVTINPTASCIVMTTEVRTRGNVGNVDFEEYVVSGVGSHARSCMGDIR